jgi:hypothetical protein
MNSGVPSTIPVAVSLTTSGQPEVHYHSPKPGWHRRIGYQHDIFGLEVAMNDLQIVGVAQAVTHLNQERNALGNREWAAASFVLAQRLSFQEGHNQVQEPVGGLAQPQDGANIRVVQPGSDGGLAAKPLD